MRLHSATILATSLVLLTHGSAHAADACGGVKLQQGTVQTGKPLSADWVQTEEGKKCLGVIVGEIDRNRLVRAVTVAVRVPDAQRTDGKALANAKTIAAALVTAGLPKNRVFAVAPRAEDNEPPSVQIKYTERAPENVLARISSLDGAVHLGPDANSLRPAEPGMPVLVNEVVQTGGNGKVWVRLKDGSGIKLTPNTLVKMVQLEFADSGARQVRVEVVQGQIETDVRKAAEGSRFDASTRVAVASVRGTSFRLGLAEDGGTRLETLEGRVALGSATQPNAPPVMVEAGQGAKVAQTGTVEPPQPLPKAPAIVGPLKGMLSPGAKLTWTPVDGAVGYRVELARDADFTVDAYTVDAKETSVALERPGAGKWFWRVSAANSQGFVGTPSKVHAFSTAQ